MEYDAIDAMQLFPTTGELVKMSINQLADYYNAAIEDFKLEHFRKVQKFQNKAIALERINHLIWILCIMVEKNNLKKQFEDMISLKIDIDRVSHKDKAAFLWEIFVTKDIKMIKSCFVGVCEHANIHRRISSVVWIEKLQAHGLKNADDRSAIVQIIPIGKEENPPKKKLIKKTPKQEEEPIEEAPKKKLLKNKTAVAIEAAPVKKLIKKKTNEENTMAKKEAAPKATKTTKTIKVAEAVEEPKKKAGKKEAPAAKPVKAEKLEVVKAPKTLAKAGLCGLYDAIMEFVRVEMEIGQQLVVKTDIGTIVASKVVNPLGVSEYSTKWTLDDIELSKAVLQFILVWNGKNNDEETNKRNPNMKPAVARWLKLHHEYVVDGMFEEEDEKPKKKGKKVKEEEPEDVDEDDDEVEEEEPAPIKKGKKAVKEDPAPAPAKKGKGKKEVEPEPEEEDEEEDGLFTEDELESDVKRKKAEKALGELFDDEELDSILDEAFDGSKTATLQAIYDAIVAAEFDAEDEDLVEALKSLV